MKYRVFLRDGLRYVVRPYDRGKNGPSPNWNNQGVALCGILKRGETLEEFVKYAQHKRKGASKNKSKYDVLATILQDEEARNAFKTITKAQRNIIYRAMEAYALSYAERHTQSPRY